MKHHPDLFDAHTLQNDTRLLFKLKLILGSVCAYGGEVPLTHSELAKKMNTSPYRIRTLLQKLVYEGIVHYDQTGKLFFNRYVFVREKEEAASRDDLYAKFFNFYLCDEFLSEDRNVQRFVIHYVGKELVYIGHYSPSGRIKDLYGENGLLNIRTRKEAMKILEKASKYLTIRVFTDSYRVDNLKSEWLDMGETHSEGAELWVLKRLQNHRFCCDMIPREAVWQLAKVMEDYYVKFTYEYATEIFDIALQKIQKNPNASYRFLNMLYKIDTPYIINEEVNELDEISAYFRAVMESAEISYAEQLGTELEALRKKMHNAEMNLFSNDTLNEVNVRVIEEAKAQHQAVWDKFLTLNRTWLRRFDVDPEWFIKNKFRISSLPIPMMDIKKKIDDHLRGRDRKPFS